VRSAREKPFPRHPAHLPLLSAAAPYPSRGPQLRLAHGQPVNGALAYFLLYQELGVGIGWFGILFAVFQLAGALGGARAHAFSERFGAKASLFLMLLSPIFYILLGLLPSLWLLPLIPANALLWNLAYPVLLERLNLAVGSDVRATVLSLAAMAAA